MTPSESYEEWLEMVREEDARNRQAFTGERPLTTTEFIHRKQYVEVDPLSEEGIAAVSDALRRRWQVPAGGKVTLITGTFSDPKLSQWFAQWFEGGDQHV